MVPNKLKEGSEIFDQPFQTHYMRRDQAVWAAIALNILYGDNTAVLDRLLSI